MNRILNHHQRIGRTCAAANPAIALQLQSTRPAGRVAELVRRLRVSCALSSTQNFVVRESRARSERTGGRAVPGWRGFDRGSGSRRVVLARPERVGGFVRGTARASSRAVRRCWHVGAFGRR